MPSAAWREAYAQPVEACRVQTVDGSTLRSDIRRSGDPPRKLVLTVRGGGPSDEALPAVLRRAPDQGPPIEVARAPADDLDRPLHLLFVTEQDAGAAARREAAQAAIDDRSVPVAAEVTGTARAGARLEVPSQDGPVKFAINPQTAARAGVVISSPLLMLAAQLVP
jgi:hypothetical protein